MSFIVEDHAIRMTRGDSAAFQLSIQHADGSTYVPAEGDEILFTVKKNAYVKECTLQKNIDPDLMLVKLEPEDTKHLSYGKYFYDVELKMASGDVFTVITYSPFLIEEEITW